MANKDIIKQKEEQVNKLAETFEKSNIILLVDYRGIDVVSDTELRKSVRELNGEYVIVKNNITRRALEKQNFSELGNTLEGPTAVVTTTGDYLPVLKKIHAFSKDNDYYEIKGGVLEGNIISVDELKVLAELPSREELLSKLAGSLLANISKLAAAVDAVKAKKEAE